VTVPFSLLTVSQYQKGKTITSMDFKKAEMMGFGDGIGIYRKTPRQQLITQFL